MKNELIGPQGMREREPVSDLLVLEETCERLNQRFLRRTFS